MSEAGDKRPREGGEAEANGAEEVPKKARTSTDLVVVETQHQIMLHQQGEQRTSSLAAPTMLLAGHQAAIYACKFHPDGETLATGSFDKDIFLWGMKGECENYNVLSGHKNAVLDLAWASDGDRLLSASADKTVCIWDAHAGKRVKKCVGHEGVVNAVAAASAKGPYIFASGGDDGSLRLWDYRARTSFQDLTHKYQILSVAFSDDAGRLFAGGIDNTIQVWDLHKNSIVDVYEGHLDTITGLALSPDGTHLLSHSMDNTVRMWDVRPFAPGNRNVKTFFGAVHGTDKNLLRVSWSPDGERVAAGSGDRMVHVWDVPSTQELYLLPGHKGTVNEVVFHPQEPVIASASSDKTVYLGELVA